MSHRGPNTTATAMRQVWAALSRNPQITYRELSLVSGLSLVGVQAALSRLERLGYIERVARQARATRVLVPFGEVRHAD